MKIAITDFNTKRYVMKNSAPGLFAYWNKSFGIMTVKNREIKHMNMIMLYKLLKGHIIIFLKKLKSFPHL